MNIDSPMADTTAVVRLGSGLEADLEGSTPLHPQHLEASNLRVLQPRGHLKESPFSCGNLRRGQTGDQPSQWRGAPATTIPLHPWAISLRSLDWLETILLPFILAGAGLHWLE